MKCILATVVALCLCVSAAASGSPVILINPANPQIGVGDTVQLNADRAVDTGNGTLIDFGIDKAVTWSSSNPAVATVSSSGLITGIASGTTLITAHINQAPFAASTQVTVITPQPFLVYVPNQRSTDLSGYSSTTVNGTLTALPGFPLATGGQGPVAMTADPAGHFAYVADSTNGYIYGYAIDAASGSLQDPRSPAAVINHLPCWSIQRAITYT